MSEQHLSKGSKLPAYAGKLRLYSMRFCPYAQRAVLALNYKKVPYEVVNVNLKEKPEWLTSKSPMGTVPALEVEENVCIYESLIVAEYVDDKYPEPRMTSEDPLRKAMDKLIVEKFNKVITAYYKGLFGGGDLDDSTVNDINNGLENLQQELKNRGTKFLSGDKPGMVDYMIWPWFERIELIPIFANGKGALDKDKLKLLFNWIEAMKDDAVVKTHYLSLDKHQKFIESYINDATDYDFASKQQDAPVCGWKPKSKK